MNLKLSNFFKNTLYLNSFYLSLNSVVNCALGFFFWIIAARLYSSTDLGLSSALIAAMGSIIIVTRLGLDYSMIKYFPHGNRNAIFGSSIIITTLLVIVVTSLYVFFIDIISPDLLILKNFYIYIIFLFFLIASSISTMCGNAAISMRASKYRFLQTLILSCRLVFILPLFFINDLGIFLSVGLSFILAAMVGIHHIYKLGLKIKLTIDKKFLKESFKFSFGNYISSLLLIGIAQFLPLIVIYVVGPQQNAYFYIAFTIASTILVIPNSVAMSLFVEGSHGEKLEEITMKSLYLIFAILLPVIVIIFFLSYFILALFGIEYTSAKSLLQILIVSSVFVSIVNVYSSVIRIQNRIFELTLLSGILVLLILGLSYTLTLNYGIIGVGYAWFSTYFIGSLYVIFKMRRALLHKFQQKIAT